ncbi:MAG: DUF2917 domain-containing protein [Betaproteobacteria bacterium]|nr:DUF2917 domain-containing protein [Betaproteobacteria bacterium]MDH5351000.1 DUF2917 domain-containing protein [Betaproteobacteria bacterium]
MREYLVQGSLNLARGSVLRIEDGRDILIYVWEGELWLTEEGERRDRFVRAGEWYRLERGGAAIGYALGRTVVTLTAPRPMDFARRITLQRAGSTAPVELYNAARERAWGLRARLQRAWAALFAPRARPTTAAL